MTPERLDAALAGLETRLTRRFACAMPAQTAAIIAGTVALLRLHG